MFYVLFCMFSKFHTKNTLKTLKDTTVLDFGSLVYFKFSITLKKKMSPGEPVYKVRTS